MSERIAIGNFKRECQLCTRSLFEPRHTSQGVVTLIHTVPVLDTEEKKSPPPKQVIELDSIISLAERECGPCLFNVKNGGNCNPSNPQTIGVNAFRIQAKVD